MHVSDYLSNIYKKNYIAKDVDKIIGIVLSDDAYYYCAWEFKLLS